jgi:hypothetical protein
MKRIPQIRLRTVFLLFFCAAVGLAVGTSPAPVVDSSLVGIIDVSQLNWHYGLLSAASIAMLIGLVEQLRQLARLQPRDATERAEFAFAAWYGIVWRTVVAATIAICLLVRLLVDRQYLQLPEHQDLFWYDVIPNQLWLFGVIIVLSNSVARWRRTPSRIWQLPGQPAVTWIVGTLLVLILLPDAGMILFLVYVALAGIEEALPLAYQRIGTYPDQEAEGFRLFWISISAVGIVVLAAAALTSQKRNDSTTGRWLKSGSLLILLLAALGFCIWYYYHELSRISPDLAVAGFPGSWLDWLGAMFVAAFAISIGAHRQARGDRALTVVEFDAGKRDQMGLHESIASQLFLVAAAIAYLGETYREIFSTTTFGPMNALESARYMLQDPTSLLCIAILILSIQLAWILWRRGNDIVVWKLADLDGQRFAWNWLGLAALVAIGIPTISAYCFAFWLGPWHLYGD